MPFTSEFSSGDWVARAEEIINRVQERWLYRVELYRRYDQLSRVTHAEWRTSLFPSSLAARTFAALQEAGYYLQAESPPNPEAVFGDYRTITVYPAPTFGEWARRHFPTSGKGSLINPKATGVPSDWLVLGWLYDLPGKETLPRLIVRQVSRLPRYDGTYYLVKFEREREGGRCRREIAVLQREVKLGKSNPYLDRLVRADAEPKVTCEQLQVLSDELIIQWRTELWSILRTRRTLFELNRQEAQQRKLAVLKFNPRKPSSSA
jgi:hypothetical protein